MIMRTEGSSPKEMQARVYWWRPSGGLAELPASDELTGDSSDNLQQAGYQLVIFVRSIGRQALGPVLFSRVRRFMADRDR
jgi:hypothetical protein